MLTKNAAFRASPWEILMQCLWSPGPKFMLSLLVMVANRIIRETLI